MMKSTRVFAGFLGVLLVVGTASAQSLGEVAKKERERREANAEAGRSAVVDATGAGETLVAESTETEPSAERERVQKLERELREANEKLDELLERTSTEETVEPVEPRPPTPKERADEYQRQMVEIRNHYPDVLGRCLGSSWTNPYGEVVGYGGDTASCQQAEAMRAEYEALYHKIWAIEGASILKRNLSKRLDPNRV